ncbi:MAG: sigma factor-like helix-turn-helix DNA-binding protein [Promethearchaeota archaeon]
MERRRYSRIERTKEAKEVEDDDFEETAEKIVREIEVERRVKRALEKLESSETENQSEAKEADETRENIHRMYFEEGMTHSEIAEELGYKSTKPIQRVFREEGWKARAGKATDIEEDVRRLYFHEGLSQREVTEELGLKSVKAIRRVFEEQGWETRPKRDLELEQQVRELYFDEELNQSEVAEELGRSTRWVQDVFRRNEWEARSRKIEDIEDDIFRLYFKEERTQEETAKELNLSKDTVQRVFQEMDWESREPRRGVTMRKFETEEERAGARREHRRLTYDRIKDTREELFGTNCGICGIDSESRKHFIHKKDGSEHDDVNLWSLRDLEKINPEEWQRLCTSCHRGTHWMMEKLNMEWEEIETTRQESIEDKDSDEIISLDMTRKRLEYEHMSVEEIRKDLFGVECSICSKSESEKGLIIHNKAGLPHDRHFLWSKENLQAIDSEEWVGLCRKCHKNVHWSMSDLGTSWDSIESRMNDRIA